MFFIVNALSVKKEIKALITKHIQAQSQQAVLLPMRMKHPNLKLSPSDPDLNVRFATSACVVSQ
jgi:hypothetical protein